MPDLATACLTARGRGAMMRWSTVLSGERSAIMAKRVLMLSVISLLLGGVWAWAAEQKVTVLASFEPGGTDAFDAGGDTAVQEHATDGKFSMKLIGSADKRAKLTMSRKALSRLEGQDKLIIDAFNPGGKPVTFIVKGKDGKSNNKNEATWFQGTMTFPPGKSTVEFDLTTLVNGKGVKFTATKPRDFAVYTSTIKADNIVLFVDNVRVVRSATATTQPAATAPATAPAGK
jgi:hypothetical protein